MVHLCKHGSEMLLKNGAGYCAKDTKGLLVDLLKNNIENLPHDDASLNHIVEVEYWQLVLTDRRVQPEDSFVLIESLSVI
jgi:hypothetical protein